MVTKPVSVIGKGLRLENSLTCQEQVLKTNNVAV